MIRVIVWQDRELDETNFANSYVWKREILITANSRISAPSEEHRGNYRVLTDVAPEILPIHFDLYNRSELGPKVRHCYEGELGFA